jgi:hypothetical protein
VGSRGSAESVGSVTDRIVIDVQFRNDHNR